MAPKGSRGPESFSGSHAATRASPDLAENDSDQTATRTTCRRRGSCQRLIAASAARSLPRVPRGTARQHRSSGALVLQSAPIARVPCARPAHPAQGAPETSDRVVNSTTKVNAPPQPRCRIRNQFLPAGGIRPASPSRASRRRNRIPPVSPSRLDHAASFDPPHQSGTGR